jgi:hypothetical protein
LTGRNCLSEALGHGFDELFSAIASKNRGQDENHQNRIHIGTNWDARGEPCRLQRTNPEPIAKRKFDAKCH